MTKIAKPNTASPTLRVIKTNIIIEEFASWEINLTIKILLKENISKINNKEIKWFLFFIIKINKIKIQKTTKLVKDKFSIKTYIKVIEIVIKINRLVLNFISKKRFYRPI